jgi:molecular chaperone DnaK
MASDNKLLGQFDLVGIPPAPRGVPQIEVTFDIDANGIVHVSAKDKATGKEQTIRIQASGGLNEAEIQRLVREAETHAAEDKRRKEVAEARNQADGAIYSAEKALKDVEGRVPADVKTEVEQAVTRLKDAMQGNDAARIRQATKILADASARISQAAQQATGYRSDNAAGADQSDVIDAEFKEVDDQDRKAS